MGHETITTFTGRRDASERALEQERLFTTQRPRLTRLAVLLCGSAADAEELVQNAFEQVVRRWDEVRVPEAYLRVAVVNGARSSGRRRRSFLPTGPAAVDGFDEDAVAVRQVLGRLRGEEREVLVLRYYGQLSDGEVADALGRPLVTVKAQIARGLAKMRKVLR